MEKGGGGGRMGKKFEEKTIRQRKHELPAGKTPEKPSNVPIWAKVYDSPGRNRPVRTFSLSRARAKNFFSLSSLFPHTPSPSITSNINTNTHRHRNTHTPPMLPTPDTSHVSYSRVYEPAEDSFLLLDTLSSPGETTFLTERFHHTTSNSPSPLVVEVGTGSGVVIGFVNAHARTLFGTRSILTAGVDVNHFACHATAATVKKAAVENPDTQGIFLGAWRGDLLSPLGPGQVDVLIFNPPYVPTEELPVQDERLSEEGTLSPSARFDRDSYLLSLSYAGGKDGMEITDRLIEALPKVLSKRGCAYILLCAGNKPEEVKERIRSFGSEWKVLTVGDSGKQAGWEKLQIIRIWKENAKVAS